MICSREDALRAPPGAYHTFFFTSPLFCSDSEDMSLPLIGGRRDRNARHRLTAICLQRNLRIEDIRLDVVSSARLVAIGGCNSDTIARYRLGFATSQSPVAKDHIHRLA